MDNFIIIRMKQNIIFFYCLVGNFNKDFNDNVTDLENYTLSHTHTISTGIYMHAWQAYMHIHRTNACVHIHCIYI